MQNWTNRDSPVSLSASLEPIAVHLGRLLGLSPFVLVAEGEQELVHVPPECKLFPLIPRKVHLLTRQDAGFQRLVLVRDLLLHHVEVCEQNLRLRRDNHLLHEQVQRVTEVNKDIAEDLTSIEHSFTPIAPGMHYAVLHDQTVLLNAGLRPQTVEVGQRRLMEQREFSLKVGDGELFGVRSEGLMGIFESERSLFGDVTRDLLRMKIHWLGMQSRQRRLVDGLLELRHVYQSNAADIRLLPSGQMLDDPEQDAHYRALQQRFHALLQQAITDSLTTAFNRNRVNEALEELTTNPDSSAFSVILCDLDHFKTINDTYGHQEGDRVLVESVQIMRRALRKSDILARWGGEEFLVILHDASVEQAVSRAEHLRELIERHAFFPHHPVTCSYGVAQWLPGESTADLVAKADSALYDAKHEGRNRVVAYGHPTSSTSDCIPPLPGSVLNTPPNSTKH